jgi:hypothetical protein
MNKYVVAKDITPLRCTIVSLHERDSEARAEADESEEYGVFELIPPSEDIAVGDRAYHRSGVAWS